jgi:hypothetical protein
MKASAAQLDAFESGDRRLQSDSAGDTLALFFVVLQIVEQNPETAALLEAKHGYRADQRLASVTSIYVAGASKETDRAKHVIARCRELGLTITMDWTKGIEDARAKGYATDADCPPQVRLEAARADFNGVANADVFLLLVPAKRHGSLGAWIELGIALALNAGTREAGYYGVPRIIVVGD